MKNPITEITKCASHLLNQQGRMNGSTISSAHL